MKLENLSGAIQLARAWDLDAIDLMLLAKIAAQMKTKEPVTIMQLVESSDAASPATNHARIKSLCKRNYLKKVESAESLRYKVLEKGDRFDKFLADLARV
jgi:DNA-binding MarR family transcriptional regulator